MSDDAQNPPIGYANPPLHSRFQKGAPSANPKGRPKKPQGIDFPSALGAALAKQIEVPTPSGRRRASRVQVLTEVLAEKAARGNANALELISKLERVLFRVPEPPPGVRFGVLAVSRPLPPGEWEAEAARMARYMPTDPLEGLPGIDAAAIRRARAEKDKLARVGFSDFAADGDLDG